MACLYARGDNASTVTDAQNSHTCHAVHTSQLKMLLLFIVESWTWELIDSIGLIKPAYSGLIATSPKIARALRVVLEPKLRIYYEIRRSRFISDFGILHDSDPKWRLLPPPVPLVQLGPHHVMPMVLWHYGAVATMMLIENARLLRVIGSWDRRTTGSLRRTCRSVFREIVAAMEENVREVNFWRRLKPNDRDANIRVQIIRMRDLGGWDFPPGRMRVLCDCP